MTTYSLLQHYWWFLISLLGAILVFMLFVQGANTLIFKFKREEERNLILAATGRKWELTFTTLVTFGGAFFAAFPLFYTVSFSGAYWLWMLILVSFFLQAVSYEYQNKKGNVLGRNTFRWFLVINGYFGPFLLGVAVSSFFHGAAFDMNKNAIADLSGMPTVTWWCNSWHGLDALANIWNVIFGFAVVHLAQILGALYLRHNLSEHKNLSLAMRREILADGVPFLVLFLSWTIHLFLTKGFSFDIDGTVLMTNGKYLNNLRQMPILGIGFIIGVALVLYGMIHTLLSKLWRNGIWWTGIGTIITVLCLLVSVGYNGTPYYPSLVNLQNSLTIYNSSSSLFTLQIMSWVSLLVPVVLVYVWFCWRSIEKK